MFNNSRGSLKKKIEKKFSAFEVHNCFMVFTMLYSISKRSFDLVERYETFKLCFKVEGGTIVDFTMYYVCIQLFPHIQFLRSQT